MVTLPPEVVTVIGVMALPEHAVTLFCERVTVGAGFTVMVPLAEAVPQLGVYVLVTVMVYSLAPFGVPEMTPVLGLKLNPGSPDAVALPPPIVAIMLSMGVPAQTVWLLSLERVTEGSGFTVTVAVAVVVHPFDVEPVTV